MIEKMTKYSFILLSGESEVFLGNLQELGVVDIQRSRKPVDERSAALLDKTLNTRSAISILEKADFQKDADYSAILSAAGNIGVSGSVNERNAAEGSEADGAVAQSHEAERPEVAITLETHLRIQQAVAEAASARKLLKQISPWGEYDRNAVETLNAKGIRIRYYCVPEKAYDQSWSELAALVEIARSDGYAYFVTAAPSGEDYSFPIPETNAPEMSTAQAAEQIKALEDEIIACKARLLRLKESSLSHMRDGLNENMAELDLYLAGQVGSEAAEGHICTFEGFAPEKEKGRINQTLDEMGVLYISEDATEEDNPPIKLKNNRFSSLFESLTGMYGMPVYGEWDPTPVLSIFFLLFFAMCMGDGGYGIVLIIFGLLQTKKVVNIAMFDGLGPLISVLGIATLAVGLLFGTFFGVDLTSVAWIPEQVKNCMLTGNVNIGGSGYALQMVLALAVGVFHICLAMIIKAFLYTKRFGLRKNLSTWGWLLLIVGGLILGICAMCFSLPQTLTKILLIVIAVLSALGIYIFNTPGRSPLKNIGSGLWETYNMVTGLLGDVLSYIRLYALGLAGGMLGNAFNTIGSLLLGDHPSWQFVPYVAILLLGHTLNLLMSCLGAYVHPLRLTYVEYFKNSGYEGKGSAYNPLKK